MNDLFDWAMGGGLRKRQAELQKREAEIKARESRIKSYASKLNLDPDTLEPGQLESSQLDAVQERTDRNRRSQTEQATTLGQTSATLKKDIEDNRTKNQKDLVGADTDRGLAFMNAGREWQVEGVMPHIFGTSRTGIIDQMTNGALRLNSAGVDNQLRLEQGRRDMMSPMERFGSDLAPVLDIAKLVAGVGIALS